MHTSTYSPFSLLCTLLICLISLGACYSDPQPATCYQDGAVNDDPQALSEVCCTPDAQDLGLGTCVNAYANNPATRVLSELATCLPQGVCALECTPGENCLCTASAQCGAQCSDPSDPSQKIPCGCISTSDRDVCAAQTATSSTVCSYCRECRSDTDCTTNTRGPSCNTNTGLCGQGECTRNSECTDSETCDTFLQTCAP